MTPRITLAVAARVLRQLRRDHRTLAMLVVLPCLVMTLVWWMFQEVPGPGFGALAPAMLALIPFIVMFLVTSVTTLRERTSGTLERLLAMPMGKGDFLLGYALAFGLIATVQAALAVALSVWVLDLEVVGPVPMLAVVAVADAVLGTALGLFVSAFARTEFQAVQFMPVFISPQIFLCGLLVDTDLMPDVLQWLSEFMPMTYAVDALMQIRDSASMGSDFTGDALMLAAMALGALLLAALTMPRSTR